MKGNSMRRHALGLALACACIALACPSWAQFAADNPDWKEADVPDAPAFDVNRLVGFEVSRGVDLNFGVDPATVTIGKDGVVRYVVVARSASGALNAMYEGIRCATAEFRVYARFTPGSGWTRLPQGDWRSLRESTVSRHTMQLARQGACNGHAPPSSVPSLIRDLKQQNPERIH